MNNADVLRLVRGPAPTTEIIKQINDSDPEFRLFPEDVRHLRDRHVPAPVIEAMIARNRLEFAEVPTPGKPQPRSRNQATRGASLIVKESTPVRLRLVDNLNSRYLRLDDKVHFEVLEDVVVGNPVGRFVAIPREATAQGTITDVRRTTLMGHYGVVEVALDDVMLANGDKIAIKGVERADRHIRPGLVVFVLAPVGFVIQPKDPVWLTPLGKDAIIKDGSDFQVFTDGVADLGSAEFAQR